MKSAEYIQKLQEQWFDNTEKTRTIIDFQKYIDSNNLILSGHSLGVEALIMIAHLRNDIKACIYNDFVGNRLNRKNVLKKGENIGGLWHEIPDMFSWFTYVDLLAYIAPMPV